MYDDKHDETDGRGICIADKSTVEEESCEATQESAVGAADEDVAGVSRGTQTNQMKV